MYYCEASESEDQWRNSNLESSEQPPLTCALGHRSSLILRTQQGGSICLLCFSNLISNHNSPTVHVSYAISQLSHAVSQPAFLHGLLAFHLHIILSPLVQSLYCFTDDQIACQVIDLIVELCSAGELSVGGEFVARIADQLSSGVLSWSRRQYYLLHCLGVLLSLEASNCYTCIKDKDALISNLVLGLQLPSEDIRGEILFVLYKIIILQYSTKDGESADILLPYCPMLLHFSLDTLIKTQSDDVRLNCIALLKVLAQRGFIADIFSSESNLMNTCEDDNLTQATDGTDGSSLNLLFAEAIKAPLLSPDSQVQIATLDLIFHCLLSEGCSNKQIHVLVEEHVVDYVFEVLRVSEQKDQLVSPCILVLDLLSTAGEAFCQKLVVGFSTLTSVFPHVAEIPFHPVQTEMLKLVSSGVCNCPGVVSAKHIEEISGALTMMLRRHMNGEMGMLPEAFSSACSIFVSLMKSPSAAGASTLMILVQEASKHAVLASLSVYDKHPCELLHSLYLLKEAYEFSHEGHSRNNAASIQLRNCVIEVFEKHILPWFLKVSNDVEEESILGILETLNFVLMSCRDTKVVEFTKVLLSLSWFRLSFGWLGLYPSEKMKLRIYLTLSSIVDNLFGDGFGQSIRDAASALPSDPIDLLFLLGQKNTNNVELSYCQSAVLQILHISSLNNEMLADKKLVLASLEQYILVNSSDLLYGAADAAVIVQLLSLYSLFRGFAKASYQIPYSSDAEKIFFQVLMEREWDLSSVEIHPMSLKWLFQQERISEPLSSQILKFCRQNVSNCTEIITDGNNCSSLIMKDIAELVAVGDNFAPKLLVSSLKQLMEVENLTHEVIAMLNLIASIIYLFPAASDQLCMHGLGSAVQNLCYRYVYFPSPHQYTSILRFVFVTLSSVDPKMLHDDEAWLAVAMKLQDYLTRCVATNGWADESLLVTGVLSLILHHSTGQALLETTRFILLNTSLATLMGNTIDAVSKTGPTSLEGDEGTHNERALVFLLLLSYFYLKSLQMVLPGATSWQNFLNPSVGTESGPSKGIIYRSFCRLLHFGSPLVKLVASYCLAELLTKITDHNDGQPNQVKCSLGDIRSMVAVFEGQVFHSDVRVATNSCICLSKILGSEIHKTSLRLSNSWCRMIIEELAMSLAAPCSVSKSLMNHHKPAVYIATALLRLNTAPWIRSVFDESCISGIIENLSPNSLSAEVVLLFRELLLAAFLSSDQIACLKRIFQACRKRICMEDSEAESTGEQTRKVIAMSGDLGEVCEFLVHLVTSESHPDMDLDRLHVKNRRVLEEIELFFRSLPENARV